MASNKLERMGTLARELKLARDLWCRNISSRICARIFFGTEPYMRRRVPTRSITCTPYALASYNIPPLGPCP